jgi:hypothetical protein
VNQPKVLTRHERSDFLTPARITAEGVTNGCQNIRQTYIFASCHKTTTRGTLPWG